MTEAIRERFEEYVLRSRRAEGWKNDEDIRNHYLKRFKDGYYIDITTYQRWEGYLACSMDMKDNK